MKSDKLTTKEELFAQACVRLGDQSKACREAYKTSKMKDSTVHEMASRIASKYKVAARIKELQSKVAVIAEKKFNITAEEMLRHLNILRNSRIDEYVEYVEFDVPVITTTTTGKGKAQVTTTSTIIERRTELRFKTFDKLTEDQLMCVESIKQNRYNEIELKLHGKEWTIEKINKHIGFYEKDNEQKNPETSISVDVSKLSDAALEEIEKAYSEE
jgi:phage terminase small subunit